MLKPTQFKYRQLKTAPNFKLVKTNMTCNSMSVATNSSLEQSCVENHSCRIVTRRGLRMAYRISDLGIFTSFHAVLTKACAHTHDQGRTNWRNCRLDIYTGDPQIVRFHLVRSPVLYGFQTVLNSMDSPV